MSHQADSTVNVMVVEDDLAQARILAFRLKEMLSKHLNVAIIVNPHEALVRLQSEWVDILITDLDMPAISGLDLLKSVKKRNHSAQVIVMTAFSTTDSILEALEFGAVDYLLKPLDCSLLIKLINQADERLARWRVSLNGSFQKAQTLPAK